MKFIIFSIGMLLLIFNGCSDNPSSSDETVSGFKFTVNVKNKNSSPMSDIKVGVWNKISFNNSSLPKIFSVNEIQSSSIISFSIASQSYVDFNIYDIENNLYNTLLDNEKLQPGNYQIQFIPKKDVGTAIFKFLMVAKTDSTSNENLFRDSVYAVLLAPDPEVANIGTTDQNGSIETVNKMLFPNLYNLNDFIHTSSASPDSLGSFSLSDEIIIALTNNNSEVKYFTKIISEKENVFNLVWENGSDDYPNWGWFNKNGTVNKRLDDSSFVIPNEFKLDNNYPNPFN